MDRIKKYEPLWGSWYIEEKIGSGGFGSVYKVSKRIGNSREYAAVKFIRNTFTDQEKRNMKKAGMSDEDISRRLDDRVRRAENEIIHMNRLRGISEIVNIDDFSVIKLEDDFGYDILIRMELLTSLDDFILEHELSEEEICNLGEDICTALDYCEQAGIVHKDIKPSNIFINRSFNKNRFELGDFGLSRKTDHTTTMSKSGTTDFISPEVFLMEKAGHTSDIYGLGLTMYTLLNHNRLPFEPAYPEYIDDVSREESIRRRVNGEQIPPPYHFQDNLWKIIKKACEYRKEDRYQHASEMKEDLSKCGITILFSEEDTIEGEEQFSSLEPEENENKILKPDHSNESRTTLQKSDQDFADDLETISTIKTSQSKNGILILVAILFCFGIAVWMIAGAIKDSLDIINGLKTTTEKSEKDGDVNDGKLKVGKMINFGSYEQDNNISNGKEDITWKILDEKDGSYLLISEYGLDTKPYNDHLVNTTWEDSTLRTWLNNDFFDKAFTEEEKNIVDLTEVKVNKNPNFDSGVGNDTEDYVFLLDKSDADHYFNNDNVARRCTSTAYAKGLGSHVDNKIETSWWWLRSPGTNNCYAGIVFPDGSVYSDGVSVNREGNAVRPAMWITPGNLNIKYVDSEHDEGRSEYDDYKNLCIEIYDAVPWAERGLATKWSEFLLDEGYNITIIGVNLVSFSSNSTTRIILKKEGYGGDILKYFPGADVSIESNMERRDIVIYLGEDCIDRELPVDSGDAD